MTLLLAGSEKRALKTLERRDAQVWKGLALLCLYVIRYLRQDRCVFEAVDFGCCQAVEVSFGAELLQRGRVFLMFNRIRLGKVYLPNVGISSRERKNDYGL